MSESETQEKETEPVGNGEPEQDIVRLEPPKTRSGFIGKLRSWREARKIKKTRRTLNREGYIQWFLVDGTYPGPRYVKPKDKGGGKLEIEHDDGIYLFPREALVPSERNGMWTAVHVKGDPEPVNLGNPDEPALSAEALKDYATMRVTSEPPGFFDQFDISSSDAIKYAIAAVIILAVLRGFVSQGFGGFLGTVSALGWYL